MNVPTFLNTEGINTRHSRRYMHEIFVACLLGDFSTLRISYCASCPTSEILQYLKSKHTELLLNT